MATHSNKKPNNATEPLQNPDRPDKDKYGLLGDTAEDRHVSGATTYINLPDQGESPADQRKPPEEGTANKKP